MNLGDVLDDLQVGHIQGQSIDSIQHSPMILQAIHPVDQDLHVVGLDVVMLHHLHHWELVDLVQVDVHLVHHREGALLQLFSWSLEHFV